MKNKTFRLKKVVDYLKHFSYINLGKQLFRLIILLAICILFSLLFICITSKEPLLAIKAFFLLPFEDKDSLVQIIDEAIPLIFTGVAVSIMNKCGLCNMFVEGGFFVGAFVAAYLAPLLKLPSFLIPILCLLIGGLVSALIGYIPAKMKASLNINEFVSSLMFNYIIFWIIMYLLDGPCADPDVANKTLYLEDFMKFKVLDEDTGFSGGIFVGLGMSIIAYILLHYTKIGYRIKMTGDNPTFAKYCGIPTKRSIVSSQGIGSCIAGFGGATYILSSSRIFRFEWKSLPNYGFDGFVIAIMANNNPLLVPLASLFLGYLRVGATKMAVMTDVPNQIVYVIQAIIIILFGASFAFKKLKKKKNKVDSPSLKEVSSHA